MGRCPGVSPLPRSEPPALLEATCCGPVDRLSLLTAPRRRRWVAPPSSLPCHPCPFCFLVHV